MEDVNQVTVIPNLTVIPDDTDEVVTPTVEEERRIQREMNRQRGPRSPRQIRIGQSINFCLYGITLMIPGIAMIVVYFIVFRIPSGNLKWSPADAFVITGAILVAFSIVSEVIGLWQLCLSRYDSDEVPLDSSTRNNLYSDAPPPYSGITIGLPAVATPSISHVSHSQQPPTFESCYPNQLALPGVENSAYDSVSESEELSPPPSYAEYPSEKEMSDISPEITSDVIMNVEACRVTMVTSRTPPDSDSKSTKTISKQEKSR